MRTGLLISALCLLPVSYAVGQVYEVPTVQMAQRSQIGLSQAADMVARSTGGRVLSAQTVQEGGREIHRIKVLTRSGEVRIVRVDAATGRME